MISTESEEEKLLKATNAFLGINKQALWHFRSAETKECANLGVFVWQETKAELWGGLCSTRKLTPLLQALRQSHQPLHR